MKKLWTKFLRLFSEPNGIPVAINRKERRTRDAIARKQVSKRSLRNEQKNQ